MTESEIKKLALAYAIFSAGFRLFVVLVGCDIMFAETH